MGTEAWGTFQGEGEGMGVVDTSLVEGVDQNNDEVLDHPFHEAEVHGTLEDHEDVGDKVLASLETPSSCFC